ncbi:MAG TPA: DNA topoisomerase VI subunit B [Planctomycetota bacterium]|nr:DNA topoisomerase VI subunit B [Planctomycetota bacterium]
MAVKSENAALSRAKSAPPGGNGNGAEAAPRKSYKGATAQEMSARQRDISVAEFFQKNRHMLGFDNKRKALLTTVKEAVDNSLDACEEAGILPDITVKIEVARNGDGTMPVSPAQAERFIITVGDNGPGIVKKNVGKVFAKLLYGSKFHRLRMSRGQQGIGISAAGMYGQLTTGKPTKVLSKIKGDEKIHSFEISIDTKRNEPVEHETSEYLWNAEEGTGTCKEKGVKPIKWTTESGTSVAIELTGEYRKGKQSVDEYLELTSVANPHAQFTYISPDGEKRVFPRGIDYLPEQPKEIKPHPHGIELGMLLKMLQDTSSHWLSGFLAADFCRVSTKNAEEICKAAGLSPRARPRDIVGPDAEKLFKALQSAKLMAPPTDCISPIGKQAIEAGLLKSIKADFYYAVTRPPKVYRGNPFVIEAGIAFGKGDGSAAKDPAEIAAEELKKAENGEIEAKAEGEEDDDEVTLAEVIRFANRVPLQYQATACAAYKSVLKTSWKNYGVSQSKGALPQGPMTIFVHIASVWVPFTNQAKEAIAEYDEIMDEIKRAVQDCGRKLGIWIRKRQHAKNEFERRNIFQRYIEEVVESCNKIKGGKLDTEKLKKQLQKIAEEITGGEEVDKLLNKTKDEDDLSDVIIRTADGIKGNVSALAVQAAGLTAQQPSPGEGVPGATPLAGKTAELIEGATDKKDGKKLKTPIPTKETAKKIAAKGKEKKKGKKDGPGLFE